MKILIHKKTKQVKAITSGLIEYDKNIFTLKDITFTKAQKDKIDKGYRIMYNRKLILEEPEQIKKINLKQEIDNAKDINEIKQIIKKLI